MLQLHHHHHAYLLANFHSSPLSFFLLSLTALPANFKTSAVRYSILPTGIEDLETDLEAFGLPLPPLVVVVVPLELIFWLNLEKLKTLKLDFGSKFQREKRLSAISPSQTQSIKFQFQRRKKRKFVEEEGSEKGMCGIFMCMVFFNLKMEVNKWDGLLYGCFEQRRRGFWGLTREEEREEGRRKPRVFWTFHMCLGSLREKSHLTCVLLTCPESYLVTTCHISAMLLIIFHLTKKCNWDQI